ncbi:MAG: amidohydrolase family protein [Eubacteriales bacterium]|nr:amidohydrolase family protein [Eubacteriales bacterium]
MNNFADVHVHMTDINFNKCQTFLDEIAGRGITNVALQSLTYRSIVYNLSLLYWKENYKNMEVAVFGMIHNNDIYKDISFEFQAKALVDMGCDGIKFMYSPDTRKKLGHAICDLRYDKMFTYLEENNIPILIHVNDPEKFWEKREMTEYEKSRGWGYFDGTYLSKQEIYEEAFAMLNKHPKLRVTFAHFFFLSCFIEEAERVMETYPNVNFDLAPGVEMFLGFSDQIDVWQEFFEKYSDRILFGTDCNNTKNFNPYIYQLVRMAISHDKTEFKMPCYGGHIIKGLDLSENALDKICYKNYIRFVGTPKAVNMDMVLIAAKKILGDIQLLEEEQAAEVEAWAKELIDRCIG